jgi:single-strand DNA-binding protein
MSDDLHTLSITGRLGRDPSLRDVGGSTVLELNVAVNHRAKKDGQWTDVATWYRCSVWGKRGESLAKLLHKGDRVAASGDHEPREYTGKDGARKTSEELANATVYLLGSKQDGQQRAAQHTTGPAGDYFPDPDGDGTGDAVASATDDEIPF